MVNKLNLKKTFELYEEALNLIPGAILGIRRPYNFVEGELLPDLFSHDEMPEMGWVEGTSKDSYARDVCCSF